MVLQKVLGLGIVLCVIEYAILIFCLQIYEVKMYDISFADFGGAITSATEITVVKMLFYFIFWVVAILIINKLGFIRSLFRLSIVNCSLFVFTSIVMTAVFPFSKEYFMRPFFYFLFIATIVSPYLLSIIPKVNQIIPLTYQADEK